MTGSNDQHYLPAALIGGFGEPSKSGRPRKARIAVWHKQSGSVFCERAENVGWERNTYRIGSLPAPLNDIIDSLWDHYEPHLPAAVSALARRRASDDDLAAIHLHVACAAVRLPGFPDLLRQRMAQNGEEITDDDARVGRLEWILRGLTMDMWCWRSLHVPDDVRTPLLLPSSGFVKFLEARDSDRELLFLPLGPRVGLLGTKSRPNMVAGFAAIEHRDLTMTSTKFLNDLAVLDHNSTMIFTHPARKDRLEKTVSTPPVEGERRLGDGPYRMTLEDWFG